MGIATTGRGRFTRSAVRCVEVRRAAEEPATGGYRAVTMGDGKDDWVVLNDSGRIVYRGYMLFAARVASRLNAG